MSQWNDIAGQADLNRLLALCGGFHDCCIASASYRSGAFVDRRRAMHFGQAADCQLSVIFHFQGEPRAVELCFTGLRRLYLTGWQELYDALILEARLAFCEVPSPEGPRKLLVWTDCGDWDIRPDGAAAPGPAGTYIAAEALKWRVVEGSG